MINASNPADLNNAQLNNWLQLNIGSFKDVIGIGANLGYVFLNIKIPFSGNNVPDLINYNVNSIINFLVSNGYTTCCGNCGKNHQNIECYNINDNYGYFCNDCIVKIEENFKKNKVQTTTVHSELLKGILGAVCGALLGLIVWVIIYKLGFISAFGGFVIAFGTLFGFEKMGKILNKKSAIICIIIIILTVWLANKVSWALDAYSSLKGYYSFFECFKLLSELIKVSNLTSEYYSDLFMGYFFTVIGSYKMILQVFRNSTGYYKIKKVFQ